MGGRIRQGSMEGEIKGGGLPETPRHVNVTVGVDSSCWG